MELIKRLPYSVYSETTTVSWRWLFNLCCSFSGSHDNADCIELEENRLLSWRENSEKVYPTINLEEAAELIVESVPQFSSLQVTEVDDDDSQDLSDLDAKLPLEEDAKTIAAEEFEKTGEASKRDDEARSDVSDERIPKFGTVIVSFKFAMLRSLLTVVFHGVDYLPQKNVGGCSAYQLFASIFDENDKKLFRWNSTQFTSTSFKIEQVMEYPEMSAKNISSTAVRIRLYGCERKRRSILLSETIVGLGNINLKKPDQYRLRMERRAELKHLDKRNEMVNEEQDFSKEMSKKAKISVEEPIGNQSELLVGLGYNPITGRLTVEITKGNSFKNPLSRGDEKLPNSYVKVTICAANNQEITRSKSELRRNQVNPLFKEKFMFPIAEYKLPEVTIIFGVYHKKSVHRKEIIGWFSIGLNNTSDEELSHWKNMLDANGEIVFQWHLLQQNTISRRGLPGAD